MTACASTSRAPSSTPTWSPASSAPSPHRSTSSSSPTTAACSAPGSPTSARRRRSHHADHADPQSRPGAGVRGLVRGHDRVLPAAVGGAAVRRVGRGRRGRGRAGHGGADGGHGGRGAGRPPADGQVRVPGDAGGRAGAARGAGPRPARRLHPGRDRGRQRRPGAGLRGLSWSSCGALVALLVPRERRGEGLGLFGIVVGVPGVAALPLGVWLVGRAGYPPVFVAGALAALAGLAVVGGLPGRQRGPERAGRDPDRAAHPGPSRGRRSPSRPRPWRPGWW